MTASQVERFYEQLDGLAAKLNGGRQLASCHGHMDWPSHGVYFFYEPNEYRASGNEQFRVVRVGTHAVSAGSSRTLWNRLSNHKGTGSGSGNHRGSVFRRHVGVALMRQNPAAFAVKTWNIKPPPESGTIDREAEFALERAVSEFLGRMTVLWLSVPGPASIASGRAYIERNAIALLTRNGGAQRSPMWLGRHSGSSTIRESGLWNVDHVGGPYDSDFLSRFERYVDQVQRR
jgi:hypothetical protein